MSIALRSALLTTCLLASHLIAADESTFKTPPFCHGLDCPKYTVAEKTSEYEVRKYEPSKWVSTKVEEVSFGKAQSVGFRYISGANKERKEIPMTCPVRTEVTPGSGPFCKSGFTVSFFVPFDYTDATPSPSSDEVFVQEEPGITAYVTSFGGYMTQREVIRKASDLIKTLTEKKISVKTDTYYASGYDSPFRPFRRHNEIWIIGNDDIPVV